MMAINDHYNTQIFHDMGGSYTVADTTTLKWPNSNITTSTYTTPYYGESLTVQGDASFSGDLKIKGKSLAKSLEEIEEKLAILHPNPELEEKWENLRGLRKMYMDLEKEIIEKEKMWAILKR